MIDVQVFKLPTKNDNQCDIERMLNKLETRYRRGEKLDEVELTWMDQANSWVMTG